jgi:hypothetical protein
LWEPWEAFWLWTSQRVVFLCWKCLEHAHLRNYFKMHVEQVKVSTLNCLKLKNYEVKLGVSLNWKLIEALIV